MPSGLLDGITVLDLASVGPAARTSRWLADYGARVVKVGPPPKQSGVQIVPPFYAYSGHRGMERVLLDLKHASGRDAFLRLAARADVVIESFRPGVVDRLGIGPDAVRAVNPAHRLLLDQRLRADRPAIAVGRARPQLPRGRRLPRLLGARRRRAVPRCPGATVGDAAGGGMQAVIAILAALVHRGATGEGATLDVSVADGVVALMSLYVDEYLATGDVPGPGHNILTGRYACYDVYRCADDRWIAVGAIEPHFYANLCRALECEQWIAHQTDDAVQDDDPRRLPRRVRAADRDEWVAELGPADTCVSEVATVPEVVRDEHFRDRAVFTHRDRRAARRLRTGRLGARGHGPRAAGPGGARRRPSPTPTRLLGEVGYSAAEIAALREEGVAA